MSYCCVTGCSNRNNSKRKNWEQLETEKKNCNKFSFHLFPKDVDRRDKWLKALNLKNWNPCKTAAVCSAHFKEDDYESNHSKKKLKIDAIPYLLKEQSLQKSVFILENDKVDTCNREILASSEVTNSYYTDHSYHIIYKNVAVQNTPTMVNQSTCVSPERIFNDPTKVRLREIHAKEIKLLKRKLYTTRTNERKAKEKLNTLKTILKELGKHNLIPRGKSDILQHADIFLSEDSTKE